jgi:predicted transcriptional regulator
MSQNGAGVARAEERVVDSPNPVPANVNAAGTVAVKSRRSLLDLAPLELDCMHTLWALQEGTVREIRDNLAVKLPRAYTTIMTIMDRLTRKGVVERQKAGRSYVYRPQLSLDEARRQAMRQVVDHFFDGSAEAAAGFLKAPASAFAAAAGAGAGAVSASAAATASGFRGERAHDEKIEAPAAPPPVPSASFTGSTMNAPTDAPILSSASPAAALEEVPAPIEAADETKLPE